MIASVLPTFIKRHRLAPRISDALQKAVFSRKDPYKHLEHAAALALPLNEAAGIAAAAEAEPRGKTNT